MKKIILLLSLFLIMFFALPIQAQEKGITYYEGKLMQIDPTNKVMKIELTNGDQKGKRFSIPFIDATQVQKQGLREGDEIILSYSKLNGRENIYIVDHVRQKPLLILFFVFLVIVFAVGRWKGFFSFAGMIFSFLIIGNMIVPSILAGTDPVVISLLGALFIIPVSFYIAHGINKHTTVAVFSTFAALLLTGVLAYLFVELTRLTGFAAEEAVYIQTIKGASINIKNLLLAGIIIGAMGVLDDVTISQTSVIEKLIKANPKLSTGELFKLGMEVGRDHIASLVNTLVLVYAGASLPLFLLFYQSQMSYSLVLNQEIIATEIVRTLISSIGIIAAVPITTFFASLVIKNKK